jgi:hypothetical protein
MSLEEGLFDAVLDGDVTRVKKLLEKGAYVNARDYIHWTPLHWAAFNGNADIAELLIKYGADVNAKNNNDYTPLHFAAMKGYADVVKLLLEKGADPTIRGIFGKTPLDFARAQGFTNIANLIEEFSKKSAETSDTKKERMGETLQILKVEFSSFVAGEWGKLFLKVNGRGKATITVEGDIEWLKPETVELAGESFVEIPVKLKAPGEVPVKVSVESSGLKTSRIIWLKVAEKARKCSACGAQVEPGAKYCWKCGAKLE